VGLWEYNYFRTFVISSFFDGPRKKEASWSPEGAAAPSRGNADVKEPTFFVIKLLDTHV
jgi:hypothetical protein